MAAFLAVLLARNPFSSFIIQVLNLQDTFGFSSLLRAAFIAIEATIFITAIATASIELQSFSYFAFSTLARIHSWVISCWRDYFIFD